MNDARRESAGRALEVGEIQRVLSRFRQELERLREEKKSVAARLAELWEKENAWAREQRAAGVCHPSGHHRPDFIAAQYRLEGEDTTLGWCIAYLEVTISQTFRSEVERFHG